MIGSGEVAKANEVILKSANPEKHSKKFVVRGEIEASPAASEPESTPELRYAILSEGPLVVVHLVSRI